MNKSIFKLLISALASVVMFFPTNILVGRFFSSVGVFASSYLLFITFIAILFYSLEAWELRNVTEKEQKIRLRAYISSNSGEFKKSEGNDFFNYYFRIKNFGQTPALKARVNCYHIIDGLEIKFDDKDVESRINPGETLEMQFSLKGGVHLLLFRKRRRKAFLKIEVTYYDIFERYWCYYHLLEVNSVSKQDDFGSIKEDEYLLED